MVENLENTKNYKEKAILSIILQCNGHILAYYYNKMLFSKHDWIIIYVKL